MVGRISERNSRLVQAGVVVIENRESFLARVAWMSPEEQADVELAYALAKGHHDHQFRKEKNPDGSFVRYFEHLRRTALIMMDELGLSQVVLIVMCLLHDAVEDTHISMNVLQHKFGAEICTNVKLMSKAPQIGLDKENFHKRHMTVSPWKVLMVKGCDRLDNLRHMKDAAPEFVKKQLKETRLEYYELLDRLVDLSPPEVKDSATLLRKMIRDTAEALDA